MIRNLEVLSQVPTYTCIPPLFFPIHFAMSTTESPKAPKGKGKEKEKKPKPTGGGQKSQTERLKTVVRRLPPNLPEEIFWQSVAKWVTDETVMWKTYYPGKFKTRCVVVRRLRACSRKLKHEACRASAG